MVWLVALWVDAWMEAVEEVLSLTAVLTRHLGMIVGIPHSSEQKARAAGPHLTDPHSRRCRFACAHIQRARPLRSVRVQAMTFLRLR